ncbi:hypothetical protein [Acinetobacter sp.]|uniref:hypothetical protein n=1 Tax=Acinetobacter sp. TaxID=472 RepID=UPI00388D301E
MHSTDDLNDGYKGSGTHLSRSVKKHGKENHICEILEFCVDRESLGAREDELITDELRKDPLCMNIARGGIGNFPGYISSEESKLKNSIASKKMWEKRKAEGYIPPPQKAEHVAKRSASNIGKKRTKEQLENLNKGQQNYYKNVDPQVIKERSKKAGNARAKSWMIESEDGYVFEVKNLKTFSVEHDIKGTALYKTIHNRNFCSGFRVFIENKPVKEATAFKKRGPMPEEQKKARSESMKGKPSGVTIRVSCRYCKKETTLGALKQFHGKCT